jgi:hypothetical protein
MPTWKELWLAGQAVPLEVLGQALQIVTREREVALLNSKAAREPEEMTTMKKEKDEDNQVWRELAMSVGSKKWVTIPRDGRVGDSTTRLQKLWETVRLKLDDCSCAAMSFKIHSKRALVAPDSSWNARSNLISSG